MRICLVNGSIKNKKSTSQYLLDHLEKKLDDSLEIIKRDWESLVSLLPESCNSFVFAFPLYMDAIPSNFLDTLEKVEKNIARQNPDVRIFTMVNNAFYESIHDTYAVWMIKQWCHVAGVEFGGALAISAGPITGITPLGTGPMKNLGKCLDFLADALNGDKLLVDIMDDEIFIEPNCSRDEYMSNANRNWTKAAEKRGLTDDDLKAGL